MLCQPFQMEQKIDTVCSCLWNAQHYQQKFYDNNQTVSAL